MERITLTSFAFVSMLVMGQGFADVPDWEIVPEESAIKFTGTQNNAPISGEFKKFDGKIKFDASNLKESKIVLNIDMDSISAGFQELSSMLKTLDWFNVTTYPQATFESTSIVSNRKDYEVKGNLKVRDKTAPVVINVVLDENTPNKIKLHGSTTISRTTYGIGQGEWSGTAEIRDPVKVDFNLALTR